MIVFFGDSITRDWPIGRVTPGNCVNCGVAGETTGQMRQRFERDVLARRPAILHLLGGINDIAENQGPVTTEETAAHLAFMTVSASAQGIAVILGLLLPCTLVAKRPALRPRPAVRRLNGWIAAFASSRGIVQADYFSPLAGTEDQLRADCTDDGLHPNDTGYALMAPVARQAIDIASRRAGL